MEQKFFFVASLLHNYCRTKRISGPTELHRRINLLIRKDPPSLSMVKMVMRGRRNFEPHVWKFLEDELGLKIERYEDLAPECDPSREPIKMDNQLTFQARGFK